MVRVNGNRLAALGVALVGTVGGALTVVHLRHAAAVADPVATALEAVVPCVFSLGLVAAAGWLHLEGFAPREVGVILGWAAVGVGVMTVVLTWTVGAALVAGEAAGLGYAVANSVTAGAVLGVAGGVYDVKHRRRTGQISRIRSAAERERDRFATLFENVPSPTIYFEYTDAGPVALDVNPAFEEVFGYSQGEVVGEPIDDYIVPDSELEEAERLNRRLRDRDLSVEVTRRTADGRREFLLYTVPLGSEPSRGFATYVDITEQKRREQRLEVLHRVLRHDLRNAVNVIVGRVDALVDADDRTEREGAAEAIYRRTDRLLSTSRKARTVEQVLNATRGPNRSVELGALLRDRLAAAAEEHPELRIDRSFPAEPVWVRGNELLGAAIDNVIDNAVEHVAERPELVVTLSDEDPAVLTFNDNGPGIPEAELEVIERRRETDLEHASGLGLWLVTWIVGDVDGDAAFETTAVGTQVTLEFERADPPAD